MIYTRKIDGMYEYNMRLDCKTYFLMFIIFYKYEVKVFYYINK